ncbi:MAG: cation diffusion facilitator family transporter, partial [Kiritimatiellae bacterium]|nr:cation diffusion facilitator family transporter [Kiritimatiellia bacterium]
MEKESSSNIRAVRRITGLGMAVNLALAGLKAAVGLVCASHALVADALHSLSDLVTDFAVIFGVRYWEAPADEEHPYGHGKIQALVTLFIALMLLGVAWQLGAHAVAAFRAGRAAPPELG